MFVIIKERNKNLSQISFFCFSSPFLFLSSSSYLKSITMSKGVDMLIKIPENFHKVLLDYVPKVL